MRTSGYVIHNAETIWATGKTPAAAWADFADVLRVQGMSATTVGYTLSPASDLLLEAVREIGSSVKWRVARGVAMLPEET